MGLEAHIAQTEGDSPAGHVELTAGWLGAWQLLGASLLRGRGRTCRLELFKDSAWCALANILALKKLRTTRGNSMFKLVQLGFKKTLQFTVVSQYQLSHLSLLSR